jgi:hypothetical protein
VSSAFSYSSLESIVIPSTVQILGSFCFSYCKSLSSIIVESNSRLTRIESFAVSKSSLQSILIPSNVAILESKRFSRCESLASISFESNSRLTPIESDAFYESSLESIVIPSTVQILGWSCFSYCGSLSSISFESNSQVKRIESSAFSDSSLESIVIPRNVEFIDDPAFADVPISLISIESGNEFVVVENEFLIDIVHHKSNSNFSTSSNVDISSDIEILGSFCFSHSQSFSSISFESNSRLTRIKSEVFSYLSLQSIVIPRNVEFIDGSAFADVPISSISIESENAEIGRAHG